MTAMTETRIYRAAESVSLRRELGDILRYGHLLQALVMRDLTVRYKRSVLGFFWTMLHPLLLMVIFVMVYSTIFRKHERFFVDHADALYVKRFGLEDRVAELERELAGKQPWRRLARGAARRILG